MYYRQGSVNLKRKHKELAGPISSIVVRVGPALMGGGMLETWRTIAKRLCTGHRERNLPESSYRALPSPPPMIER